MPKGEQQEERTTTAGTITTSGAVDVEAVDFARVMVYTGGPLNMGKQGDRHSQFGQDWLAPAILGCKKEGFFIDLAANDYKFLSNTLMLERDFGWRGVCIEANAAYMYRLAHRRCQIVLAAVGSPRNKKVKFMLSGVVGGISGTAPNKQKKSVTSMHLVELSEIFRAAQVPATIDFMSLDVEGAEEIVMATFPWESHKINVMGVENCGPPLKAKLLDHGYRFLRRLGPDSWFVHSSIPEVDKILQEYGGPWKGRPTSKKNCMEELGYSRPS